MRTTAISILYLIIFFFTEPVFAQSAGTDTLPPSAGTNAPPKGFVPKKMDVHVQAGTWFATSSGYGNGWGTYIAPQLSYSLTPRFRLSGGFSVLNTTYSGYKPYYDFLSNPGSTYHGDVTSAYIYVSGQYLVNDRLTVTGSAFKKFNLYESPGAYKPYFNDEPYGANLNVQYRIGEHMYLEGGIGFTKGATNPYYGNPMYSPIQPLYNPYFPGQ